jgi:hypothetical protein
MFDDVNKSKMTFEKYVQLKRETLVKSFTERFKMVDKFLYWFSWFGNGVSIFLAFFFMQHLFFSSFNNMKDSIFITIGIIFFLTMFELLKRYILGLFSMEAIKTKFNIFRSNLITFILGVLIVIAGSFYFSLNGAYVFIDNTRVFEQETRTTLNTKVDSLNTFYFNQYIKPLMDNNKLLSDQNTGYREQASNTNFVTRYTNLINENNKRIDNNNKLIAQYEKRRDDEIEQLKETELSQLDKSIDENRYNLIAFILLSTLIELIIIIGIFYDKFYDYKSVLEYEETIINTPEFKKWHKYNFILELIFSKSKNIGDQIPSTNNIIELTEIGGAKITKGELDKIIKILYYLEIIKLEGNRRVVNQIENDAKLSLRNYFNIT